MAKASAALREATPMAAAGARPSSPQHNNRGSVCQATRKTMAAVAQSMIQPKKSLRQ